MSDGVGPAVSETHALIMAAGRGIRMMPLTALIPKPLAPYQGSTLIAEGIKQLRPHVGYVHITVGYRGAMLAEHVIGLGVDSVINTNGRGNAWWLYHSLLKELDGPLVVLTCDNVVALDFGFLLREYGRTGNPACMVVPVTPVATLDGDYVFLDGDVVTRLDRQTPSDRYCSGIQVLNPRRINQITRSEEDFYNVWNQLIAQRQLCASALYPHRWFAVDTLDHLTQLNGA